jgi:hypothetical protein
LNLFTSQFASHPAQLVMVKEIAGSGIFWPAQGINTLPVLLPGRSYFVFLNDGFYLEFVPCKNAGFTRP